MSRITGADGSPEVAFVLGGVQKAGTSALASYLAANPALALPAGKEAHVFDAPDFDDAWSTADVDTLYATHFTEAAAGTLRGDATPIYSLHPRFIDRIHRYNPDMRWILLLRHPVERMLSNYHMERGWGREKLPLWLALLCERARLRGRFEDFATDAPLRRCSYRLRSDYARQLDAIYARFPRTQVLVLRTEELAESPAETYRRTCDFLGVPVPDPAPEFARVFEGRYRPPPRGGLRWRALAWWLRRELRDMRRHDLHWNPAGTE